MPKFNSVIVETIDTAETNGNTPVNTVIYCKENQGIYLQENDNVKKYGSNIIEDSLESDSIISTLSANQGKILNEKIKVNTDKISALQEEVNSKINTSDIVNNLTSNNTDKPLSANQGKILNEKILSISGLSSDMITQDDIIDNLESIETKKPLSANQGRLLNQKIASSKIEVQNNISSLGTALYSEGYIIEGCLVSYDASLNKAFCDSGKIVLNGLIYNVDAVELEITNSSNAYQIGIYQRNDSNNNIRAEWGLKLVNEESEDAFLPLYGIINSEINEFNQPTTPDYLINIQKYDEHANGSYVVNGLIVSALQSDNDLIHTYNITEGSAHINGIEASITHSERLIVNKDIDLDNVVYESHRYAPNTYGPEYEYDSIGNFRFNLYESPVNEITQVQKDIYVSNEMHTYILGTARYELEHTSVGSDKVIKVWSGSTTYVKGTDYYVSNNSIYWYNGDTLLSSGQSFYVAYLYPDNVSSEELAIIKNSITIDETNETSTITVPNVIENTEILIFYTYKMQRIDLIVMYSDKTFGRVKGVPHRYDPQVPAVPPGSIKLAQAYQRWYGLPEVTNESIQVIKMEELNQMNSHITNLYSLVARNELRFEALANAPSSTYGVFVDSLIDGSMRDSGISQTAVISDNFLQLPMTFNSITYLTGKSNTLDYTNSVVVQQEDHPSAKLINPYQAFNDAPIQVTLSPSIDRWVEDVSSSSYVYKYIGNKAAAAAFLGNANIVQNWRIGGRYNTNVIASTSSSSTSVDDNLRQIDVNVYATGFASNEQVAIYFDGLFIKNVNADVSGIVNSTFKIPSGIPNGTKLVRIIGLQYNKEGNAYYVGTHEKRTTINYYYQIQLDPIAQTFKLSENRLISGVQFWLDKTGTSDIRVELREVSNGYPTTNTIASCIIPKSELTNANQWITANFITPVFLNADIEYCITLLCNTSDYAVGTAKLGDYVDGKGWITSQPYDVGVMFSSSNASAWTAHQTEDMAFRLLAANFNNPDYKKTISLSTAQDLTGVTDILPLMEVETTGANTDAQIFITNSNGSIIAKAQAWQSISFDSPLNGNYKVDLVLKGDSKYSPIVSRDPQLITAKIQSSGTYISRGFACGSNKKVMVTLDEYKPSGSSIMVSIQTGNGIYSNATLDNEIALGNGWYTRKYFCNCDIANTRVKIELTGSASARPCIASINAVILDV